MSRVGTDLILPTCLLDSIIMSKAKHGTIVNTVHVPPLRYLPQNIVQVHTDMF